MDDHEKTYAFSETYYVRQEDEASYDVVMRCMLLRSTCLCSTSSAKGIRLDSEHIAT